MRIIFFIFCFFKVIKWFFVRCKIEWFLVGYVDLKLFVLRWLLCYYFIEVLVGFKFMFDDLVVWLWWIFVMCFCVYFCKWIEIYYFCIVIIYDYWYYVIFFVYYELKYILIGFVVIYLIWWCFWVIINGWFVVIIEVFLFFCFIELKWCFSD